MLLIQKLSKLVETVAGENNPRSDKDKEDQTPMAGETSALATCEGAKAPSPEQGHSKFACRVVSVFKSQLNDNIPRHAGVSKYSSKPLRNKKGFMLFYTGPAKLCISDLVN